MKYAIVTFAFCLYVKAAFALPKIVTGHEPYPEQVPFVILGAIAGIGLIGCAVALFKLTRAQ